MARSRRHTRRGDPCNQHRRRPWSPEPPPMGSAGGPPSTGSARAVDHRSTASVDRPAGWARSSCSEYPSTPATSGRRRFSGSQPATTGTLNRRDRAAAVDACPGSAGASRPPVDVGNPSSVWSAGGAGPRSMLRAPSGPGDARRSPGSGSGTARRRPPRPPTDRAGRSGAGTARPAPPKNGPGPRSARPWYSTGWRAVPRGLPKG